MAQSQFFYNFIIIVIIEGGATIQSDRQEQLVSDSIYSTLVEKGNDGIVIIQDGLLKYLNPKMTTLTGYSGEEAIGNPLINFLSSQFRNKISEIHKKRMAGEEVPASYEAEIISKNGEKVPVEINASCIDYEGRNASLAIIRDITERKHYEKELEKTISLHTATLEATGDGILVVDREGRVLNYNQKFADMWEIPQRVMDARDDNQLLEFVLSQLKDPDNFLKKVRELYNQPDTFSKDFIEFKDGRIYRRYSQPMWIGKKIEGRVWSFRDVTERKQMEKTLVQLNEVLRLLNKNLRHDILNDLTVVGNSIEVYKDNKDEEILDNAMRHIEKSTELVRRMKQLESLVSSGGNLKSYSLLDVINGVKEEYGIEFNVEGDCTVLADEALGSVIDNVVENAVNHGKADEISVSIESGEDFCEMRISDNGVGVPHDIKEQIFDEGVSGGGGTGLGLYIAKKTIERWDGHIHVEDNEPNGAVFVIKLRTAQDYSGIRTSLGLPASQTQPTSNSISSDRTKSKEDSKTTEEVEVDLRGLKCPQPILKIHSKIMTMGSGSILKVVADCPTFERDLQLWASKTGKTILECIKNDGTSITAKIIA